MRHQAMEEITNRQLKRQLLTTKRLKSITTTNVTVAILHPFREQIHIAHLSIKVLFLHENHI